MRTETITVYSISELSDSAKQKAHRQYLNKGFEYFWLDEYLASLKKFAEYFNLKIKNYSLGGYDCIVEYSLMSIDNQDEIENLSGLRLARYIHNNFYYYMFKGKYYSLWSKTDKNPKNNLEKLKSRHSKIQLVCDCPFTGMCGDMDLLHPILEFLKKPDSRITFTDLMDQCINNFIKSVESDCEYQESLQYFIEHAEANAYEFTEDGNRY